MGPIRQAIRWQLSSGSQQESGHKSKLHNTTQRGHSPASRHTHTLCVEPCGCYIFDHSEGRKSPQCAQAQILTPIKTHQCAWSQGNTPTVKYVSLTKTWDRITVLMCISLFSLSMCVCVCVWVSCGIFVYFSRYLPAHSPCSSLTLMCHSTWHLHVGNAALLW